MGRWPNLDQNSSRTIGAKGFPKSFFISSLPKQPTTLLAVCNGRSLTRHFLLEMRSRGKVDEVLEKNDMKERKRRKKKMEEEEGR